MHEISCQEFPAISVLLVRNCASCSEPVVLKTQFAAASVCRRLRPLNVPNLNPNEGQTSRLSRSCRYVNRKEQEVTSDDSNQCWNGLDMLSTDDKDGNEGSWLEWPGKQWVQIDLRRKAEIYAVLIWHFHSQAACISRCCVQVSEDPTFKSGVTTVSTDDFFQHIWPWRSKDLNYSKPTRAS